MKKLIPFYALALLFSLTPSSAFAQGFNYTGYVKSYALGQDGIEVDYSGVDSFGSNEDSFSTDSTFQSQNSLRLMGSYLSEDSGYFEIHYEAQPLYYSNNINDSSRQK